MQVIGTNILYNSRKNFKALNYLCPTWQFSYRCHCFSVASQGSSYQFYLHITLESRDRCDFGKYSAKSSQHQFLFENSEHSHIPRNPWILTMISTCYLVQLQRPYLITLSNRPKHNLSDIKCHYLYPYLSWYLIEIIFLRQFQWHRKAQIMKDIINILAFIICTWWL